MQRQRIDYLAALLLACFALTSANSNAQSQVDLFTPSELMSAQQQQAEEAAAPAVPEPSVAQASMPQGEYSNRGEKDCLRCHDETWPTPVLAIFATPHGFKGDPNSPMAQQACETCHGPSPEHMGKPDEDGGRKPLAVGFGPRQLSDVEVRNQVCTDCHQRDPLMHWQSSQHESAGVACADCHQIHTRNDPIRHRAGMVDKCLDCHPTQRAQVLFPSSHPIREGRVVCADCHNPHGSPGEKLMVKGAVLDTCYQCHTEKRGPFLWEHAPVVDDCRNCHTPHGSVNPSLLKVRLPHLCQQCHQARRHPSGAYSGADIPIGFINARGCSNCHSQIHGSNHPSGVRLQR